MVDIDTGSQTALVVPLSALTSWEQAPKESWCRMMLSSASAKSPGFAGRRPGRRGDRGIEEDDLVVVNPTGMVPVRNSTENQGSCPGQLMDLALYDLKLHKGRFIATISGWGCFSPSSWP